ncbi:hypothetical protein ACW2AB_04635 [Limosilactobacillus fermentum]
MSYLKVVTDQSTLAMVPYLDPSNEIGKFENDRRGLNNSYKG